MVAAVLKGTKQIKGLLTDGEGGFCAMGVICEAAVGRAQITFGEYASVKMWAQITEREWAEIVQRNNVDGWDFLMIARKVGVPDE